MENFVLKLLMKMMIGLCVITGISAFMAIGMVFVSDPRTLIPFFGIPTLSFLVGHVIFKYTDFLDL